jgi:hypothetical protein
MRARLTFLISSSAVCSQLREDLNCIPDIEERPVESKLIGYEIYEEKVLKRLVDLNPNKSCGPDSFHPRLLKELAAVLAGPLTLFFKKKFERRNFAVRLERSSSNTFVQKR